MLASLARLLPKLTNLSVDSIEQYKQIQKNSYMNHRSEKCKTFRSLLAVFLTIMVYNLNWCLAPNDLSKSPLL